MRRALPGGFELDDDRARIDRAQVHGFLAEESYWARGRPREVQDRLSLIFTTFLRLKSASKVLQFLNTHDLRLPRRDRFGDILWKTPTVAAILAILKNPAYAGAFVYGRTRSVRLAEGAHPIWQTRPIRLPLEQWKIRVLDVYPAYLDWPTFERIQAMLQDNYAEYKQRQTRGLPRSRAAEPRDLATAHDDASVSLLSLSPVHEFRGCQ